MNRSGVGVKLGAAFGLLLALLIGVGWLGLSRMGRTNEDLNRLGHDASELELAQRGEYHANLNIRLVMQLLIRNRKEDIAIFEARRDENRNKNAEIIQALRQKIDSETEITLLNNIDAARMPARESVDHIALLMKQGRQKDATQLMISETSPLLERYQAAWDAFVQFQKDQMEQVQHQSEVNYIQIRRIAGILMSIAIVLAIAIAVLSTHRSVRDDALKEKANEEIQSLNQQLEDRIAKRTQDLAKAMEKLESEVIVRRKTFNANLEPMTIATLSEGRYIDVNESFLRVTGHQRDEVIGRTSLEIKFWKSPEDRAKFAEALKKDGTIRDQEITFLTKSGEERTAVDSAELIEFGGGKCVVAIFKDITERKNMEKQLRQAQKMEAVGQLSGGIAHDFNNLLSVIIGYSDALMERLPANDPLHHMCEQIKKAGHSAASLTRQLLAFSRQQVLEPKILDINEIVRNMEKMLRRLIGEDIEFSSVLEPNVTTIRADQGQIEQVILNLAVNARDAMPHGGRLTIQTANVELDEEYARRHPTQQPGSYVLLMIADTGTGMDVETQSHIFEPFYTTKQIGKGTGLGLSTVYGVVRQSGGHIWVYSELGHGTVFKIYLPQARQSVSAEKSSARLTAARPSTETILLVEDSDPVRELTHSLLTASGYTVLEADHPDKAIELANTYAGRIDLLLTDMVMPGMNGRALAEKLAPIRPDMKVIYTSGYTGFSHSALLDSNLVILPKPFTRESLLKKLREILTSNAELTTS